MKVEALNQIMQELSHQGLTPAAIDGIGKVLSQHVNTQEGVTDVLGQLAKAMFENMLNVEINHHLGYNKHEKAKVRRANTRNGYGTKTLKTDRGELEIRRPRDRNATFEPIVIPKGQTRLEGLDKVIQKLYAKGVSTRDASDFIKELYHGVEVSPALISAVTDSVMQEVEAWRNRPLDPIYPIVFLDCIVTKVRCHGRVIKQAVYIALAIDMTGKKQILGIWQSEESGNETAKFWAAVLTELESRGVKDVFIFCVDGLSGFAEAIELVFPKAKVQRCILHMVRNNLRYVATKDKKAVAGGLKAIYQSPTESAALQALEEFAERWLGKYPCIERSWRKHWDTLRTIFDYPPEIRKIIYTTNAIESLNSVIRKTINNRRIFPNAQSAMKMIYLAVQLAAERWTRPVRDWTAALNRLMIEYEGRFDIEN